MSGVPAIGEAGNPAREREIVVTPDNEKDGLPMQKDASASDPDHQVIPLRSTAAYRAHAAANAAKSAHEDQPPIGDLDRYPEENDDDDEDYRHRMMTNIAGVAIAVVLIVTGVWIANTMATMRKNQDCVLSGRRGCTQVEAPVPQRW